MAGLPGALLAMLTLADLAPLEGGVKVTEIVQVSVGAREVTQLLICEKEGTLAPVRLTALMVRVAPPVLVTVIIRALLETPSPSLPNAMLAVLRESAGPLVPVPVMGTAVGLPGALLTMLRLADLAPVDVGVKVTKIVHWIAGVTGVVQLLVVMAKEGTLAPVRVTELMTRFAVPELSTVIICAVLEVPTVWLPNATEAGTVIAGVPACEIAGINSRFRASSASERRGKVVGIMATFPWEREFLAAIIA
jgi:hypothetical protein